ncbi:probable peptidase [Vibrio ishigakensis]|uniref:Probable peptidase n=1 Tax=Vibrio ishigakensis TaxID=1481914 RepID=A0A0B8NUY4_9VIBR|nr:probable peptidase [Vibrio ishigakensis]
MIEFEAELFEKKQAHQLSYVDENGNSVDASLPVLASIIRTNENADVRQSAHKALLDLEQWLLQNGFIELVKLRNKFAQSLGYGSFFDYSVEKTEHMTTEELFTILDDFEQRTREANERSLKQLASDKGEQALTGITSTSHSPAML